MKKIITFRTETANKKLLIEKASELQITLSELMDQISSEFYLEKENDHQGSLESNDTIRQIAERGLYGRRRLWKMIQFLRENEKNQNDNDDFKKAYKELKGL